MRPMNCMILALCAFVGCGDDGSTQTPADTDPATESGDPSSTTDADPTVGGQESTGEASSTGLEETSTGSEEDSTGAPAGCYAPQSSCFDNPFEPFACGGAAVCDALEVDDPSLNEFDPGELGFVNPEAATCILEGLRDQTPGTYRIEVEPGQQYSRWTDIEVLTDGSVLVHLSVQDDKCIDETGSWAPLRDAQIFQDCLDSGDEVAMLDCMRTPGDEASCIEGPTVCP